MLLRSLRFVLNGKLHLYSGLLLVATFVWMSLPYNNGLDMTIQKWIQIIKIGIFENKPKTDQIIFVNVAKSRYLLPANGDSTENDVVVNRRCLIQLFQAIVAHQNKVGYVLADVIFDTPSPDDSLLKQTIKSLGKKFLTIDTYSAKDSLQKNELNVRSATATVTLQSGSVYKMPFTGMFGDTLVPCKLYIDLQDARMSQNGLFTWFYGKGIAFNSQINDLYLRANDFDDGGYVKIGLGELVSLMKISPQVFREYLQDRIILIGDFENDRHATYLNSQPGTLLLFDAYWHLKMNRQLLSVWYLFTLYIFLYVIVWLQLSQKSYIHEFKLKIRFFEPFVIPVNIITVSMLLIAFTIFSALVFGVNISIFHLIGIFSIVDLIKFFKGKMAIRQGSSS